MVFSILKLVALDQLDVKNLNTKTRGPYLFPFKQFQVYDDTISIQGYLKKKQKIVRNVILL